MAPERLRQTPPEVRQRSLPAGGVLAAGLLALVVAALLNADALVRDAQAKELGSTGREVSLAIWEPVQDVAGFFRLTAPREFGDLALGRDLDEERFELPASDAVVAETVSIEDEPQTPPPEPERRAPTADDPLEVWVGGDSMSGVFGESVLRIGTDLRVLDVAQDTRISTGLARPDFFDWPARLDEVVTDDDPEVMLVMFGANDAQGMETDQGTFQFGEQGWIDEYRRRVAGVMDLLTADRERLVVWVGQPSARDSGLSQGMELVNGIFRSEADRRDDVVFLDSWDLLNTPDGQFSVVLADDSGAMVTMRAGDGFHLTRSGGDRLAIAALREISSRFDVAGVGGGGADGTDTGDETVEPAAVDDSADGG